MSRLGVPRPLLPASSDAVLPAFSPSRHVRERPRIRTAVGQSYDDLLDLKRARNAERQRLCSLKVDGVASDGGAAVQYFTLPHVVRAESEDSPSSPRTVRAVLGQSEQS